ncbi:hypothetical protein KocCE7_12145 [Kocuria marina subsp. indica]|uniref:FAD-dependent monooxygenase n=1 Tax=Kocuria TaxID=57493 RepID=UPI00103FB879|nr:MULTISPECIES: FAD-dependent monooxygenase [Kocuria]MDT0120026.1 FAD-dependent monooxygenase [Kocuria sp. PD6]QBJ22425.1 hypothetical protein KocCE7_12145 [Kocuria indica]
MTTPAEPPTVRTTCAIVGGGPAGLVLGLLLARAGVAVTVLEKHADFLRDFRGDTVHPTTLALLDDLGLFDRFEAIPHSRVTHVDLPEHEVTGVTWEKGRVAIGIPRDGYIQVAQLGPKGADDAVRARGLDTFRADAAQLLPEAAAGVTGIGSTADVKHLDVRLDRLRRWHAPGVLCIGDAAHAMSPVGGVGINLAVQDAVAAARILAPLLRSGGASGRAEARGLARIQRRRMVPTVVIQGMQRILHAALIMPAIRGRDLRPPSWIVKVVRRVPWLSALPALAVGVGPRPERAPRWARRPS